ncbi:MAG: sulfotransferase domain-containing protein [Flavobacteriaceae bacterium]|nr:sulfotransferase domain-containing protein [Flavobacteriaceae bacterium]
MKSPTIVNLFIPGAAKSGTSSLHDLLNLHPEICMSKNKEPHFWTNKSLSENSQIEISGYLENFNLKEKHTYYGESSTGYFYFPVLKENILSIKEYKPKFIFILRNPIDRTYSHYCYVQSLGSEDDNFEDAILKNYQKEPLPEDLLPERIVKNYYQYSLYGKWISKFYDTFDENQIKIILFEDLKENQLQTLNECFDFLNLSKLDEIPEIKSNVTVKTKFPKIYKNLRVLTLSKNKFRDVVKHFFPKKFRRKYKKNISEVFLNLTKTNERFPKLSKEQREWLFQLYKEDIALLKMRTDLDLKKWKDFN